MLAKPLITRSDMIPCVLCKDAPCSSACPAMDPAGALLAIRFDDRKPKLNGSKCVGCHLCRLVCPEGAITVGKKRIKV